VSALTRRATVLRQARDLVDLRLPTLRRFTRRMLFLFHRYHRLHQQYYEVTPRCRENIAAQRVRDYELEVAI
jgi:hypothetical protein